MTANQPRTFPALQSALLEPARSPRNAAASPPPRGPAPSLADFWPAGSQPGWAPSPSLPCPPAPSLSEPGQPAMQQHVLPGCLACSHLTLSCSLRTSSQPGPPPPPPPPRYLPPPNCGSSASPILTHLRIHSPSQPCTFCASQVHRKGYPRWEFWFGPLRFFSSPNERCRLWGVLYLI
jgi:hypothetical protein